MQEIESPRRLKRRLRLVELLAENGGAAQVARETGTPKSHFSALTAGKRGLGDDLAQKLEAAYNKPSGWFDAGSMVATLDELKAAPATKAADEPPTRAVSLSPYAQTLGLMFDSLPDDKILQSKVYARLIATLLEVIDPEEPEPQPEPVASSRPKKLSV